MILYQRDLSKSCLNNGLNQVHVQVTINIFLAFISISPERLFLELCVSQSDALFAEQLGISLSLDLNFLLEIAADFLLRHGNSKQATRLFHMSKVCKYFFKA